MEDLQGIIDRLNWALEGKAESDEYDRGYRDAIKHAIKVVTEEKEAAIARQEKQAENQNRGFNRGA